MEPQTAPSLDDIKAFLNTPQQGPSVDQIKDFLNSKPQPSTMEDMARGAASGLVHGLPTAIDVPAAVLATGVEKLTGSQGTMGQLFQQNLSNGLNAGVSKITGPEYQPLGEAGTLAKGAGAAVGALPLGGAGALAEGVVPAVGRAVASGVGGTAGGQIGQKFGGTPGAIIGGLAGAVAGSYSPEIVASTPAQAVVSKVGQVGEDFNQGIQNIKSGVWARGGEELNQAVTAMKAQSSDLYKQSKDAGAVLNDTAVNGIVKSVGDAVNETGKLHPRLHDDTISVLSDLEAAAKDGNLSLEELDQNRRLLQGVVNKNRLSNPEDAFKATTAINALDDAVDKLGPSDVQSGDTSAIDALGQARFQWAQAKKFENLADVAKKADGDPNRIKALLQGFVNNKKNLRGYTGDEKAALTDAATNGTGEKIFKMLGKFGLDLGSSRTAGVTAIPALIEGGALLHGGTGEGMAAVPAIAAATGARQLQKYLARGKLENALKTIQNTSQAPNPRDIIRRTP